MKTRMEMNLSKAVLFLMLLVVSVVSGYIKNDPSAILHKTQHTSYNGVAAHK